MTRDPGVFALPIVKVVGNVYAGGGPSNCGTLAEYGGVVRKLVRHVCRKSFVTGVALIFIANTQGPR